MSRILRGFCCALALMACCASSGWAQETIKIGEIEPLSGPMASAGNQTAKHFQFLIDQINATGGIGGKKIELMLFDSKFNPQESILAAEKAIAAGARIIFQASGSSVGAALADFIVKHNTRNPNQTALLFHYNSIDPATTDETCNYWQFRFSAHTGMLLRALAKHFQSQPQIKKVYLINQDYLYGRTISTTARSLFEQQGIEIVGDDLHPLGRVKDFTPYVAKIKSSGADAVVTGNWANDMTLLIRAAIDAGLKTAWYTFYGATPGTPTAIGKSGVGLLKVVTDWHSNVPDPKIDKIITEFKAKTGYDFIYYRAVVQMDMLARAITKVGSVDANKIAAELATMREDAVTGEWVMRPEDHQISHPIVIATLSDNIPHDLENTGLGFKTDAKIAREDIVTPVKCTVKPPK